MKTKQQIVIEENQMIEILFTGADPLGYIVSSEWIRQALAEQASKHDWKSTEIS